MADPAKLARRLEAELKRLGNPERAAGEKQYLKSDLSFYGVALAEMRRLAKDVSRTAQVDHDDVLALAEELWSKPVFERRMMAVILLELHAHELGPPDLRLIERLIRESNTWALVDGLAGDVVSTMALHHSIRQTLDRWARDEDFWIRRSSLLAELKPLKSGASFEPFAKRADAMLEEAEFFIRKAIGWVLREMSKKRPDEVYDWIAPRAHRASGVTMREVVRHLDTKRAELLMRAYKARRPA
ncbi:MAG TPA: DNA alkylation repair protein [Actinomycetota bacterium]|nr:DNA alkylation repair protein [Actinomycetota bacterium]